MSTQQSDKPDLLKSVIEAAGGLERFNKIETITAANEVSGLFWMIKGYPGRANPTAYVSTKTPRVIFHNLGGHLDNENTHLRWIWTPQKTSVERPDGTVILSREDPFKHFAEHTLQTPWDDLDLLYFRGYATWNYLMAPFYFTYPENKIKTCEIQPHKENGQTWRVLEVTYPEGFATHSRTQQYYYDEQFHLRRLDYTVEVNGGGSVVSHYCYDEKTVEGISFPMLRRALAIQDGVGVGPSMVLVNFTKISVKGAEVRSNL